jgi:hypothetical protein
MIKVLCVRSNKKLLKGQLYDCNYIDTTFHRWNNTVSNRRTNLVGLVGFGSYSTSGFRMEDGSPIPMDYLYDKRPKYTSPYEQDINVGDWVICNTNSFKSLIKGQKYQVEEVIKAKGDVRWNNKHKIKLKGSKRFVDFGWNFKIVPKDESREIALNAIFGENVLAGEVGKIDDKELILVKALAKSILDPNRHRLSIVEWAIEKYGKCGITQDDFKNLLNKKLKSILEIENL